MVSQDVLDRYNKAASTLGLQPLNVQQVTKMEMNLNDDNMTALAELIEAQGDVPTDLLSRALTIDSDFLVPVYTKIVDLRERGKPKESGESVMKKTWLIDIVGLQQSWHQKFPGTILRLGHGREDHFINGLMLLSDEYTKDFKGVIEEVWEGFSSVSDAYHEGTDLVGKKAQIKLYSLAFPQILDFLRRCKPKEGVSNYLLEFSGGRLTFIPEEEGCV